MELPTPPSFGPLSSSFLGKAHFWATRPARKGRFCDQGSDSPPFPGKVGVQSLWREHRMKVWTKIPVDLLPESALPPAARRQGTR
jgi:hypothetical protein